MSFPGLSGLILKIAGIFNCVAQLQENVLQKTVTHILLPGLKEDASVTR